MKAFVALLIALTALACNPPAPQRARVVAGGRSGHAATSADATPAVPPARFLPASRRVWSGFELTAGDWTFLDRIGDTGNSESQGYAPANATLSSGLLTLTAQVAASHGQAYKSAMAQWGSYSFTFGKVSVRAKMAGGTGAWPAVWMLGAACQTTNITTADNSGTCPSSGCCWPDAFSNEIDIAEGGTSCTGDKSHILQVTHTAAGQGGCGTAALSDYSTNFHTYGLDWSSSHVIWSIDGTTTCTESNSSFVPQNPMFLIVNIAMGGNCGGGITDGTLPVSTVVSSATITQ